MSSHNTPRTSVAKSGSSQLVGNVTLSEGTNISLTQSGQDISFATSTTPTFTSLTISGLTADRVVYTGTGGLLSTNTNLRYDGSTLSVRGTSGQTANIFEVYNGGATRRSLSITNNASDQSTVSLFPDPITVTAAQNFLVFNTDLTWSINSGFFGIAFAPGVIITTTQSLVSSHHNPLGVSITLKNDGVYSGHLGTLTSLGGGGVVQSDTTACSTDTITGLAAGFTLQGLSGGTLTATNVIGATASLSVVTGATVTNYIGFQVNAPAIVGGTVTNKIGLSIAEFTGSNNYAIISTGVTTKTRHAGDFWMPRDGANDLTHRMQIQGRAGNRHVLYLEATDTGQSADIFRIDNAAGTQTLAFNDTGTLTLSQYPAGWLKTNSSGVVAPALGSANQVAGIDSAGTDIEFKSILGTSNQITVTHGANSITLSTPQNIHTGASPTFAGLTLSGFSTAGIVTNNSSGVLASSLGTANQVLGVNNAANAHEFKTISGTSNQITVTHGAGTITLSTPQNIHTGASPTFAGLTLSGMTAGSVIFAGTSGVLSQDNSNFFYDNTNDRLGVGVNSSLTAKIQTTIGGATEIGLLIRAAASQSGKLISFLNSSGNAVASHNFSGDLTLGELARTISATTEFVSVPAVTHTVSAAVGVSGYRSTATLNFSVTSGLANNFFFDNTSYKNDAALVGGTLGSIRSFATGNTFTADTNAWSISNVQGFLDSKTLSRTNGGTLDVINIFHYRAALTINTGATLENRYGFQVLAATVSGTFNGEHIGHDCADLSGGTTIAAYRSQMTSGSAKWAILSEGSAASAHVGLFRFGDTTAPTAAIDIAGAQAGHIRMGGSTSDPAASTVGDIWYHTTRKNHSLNSTMGIGGIMSVIHANTSNSTAIANTVTETAFDGQFQFPANSLTIGTVIRAEWAGIYSTTGTPTLNLRVRYGAAGTGVSLIDFGTVATASGASNRKWVVRFTAIVRTIGASGTIACHAELVLNNGASELVTGSDVAQSTNSTATIDTTAATNFNLTVQWSAASASNTTTRINHIVEKGAK